MGSEETVTYLRLCAISVKTLQCFLFCGRAASTCQENAIAPVGSRSGWRGGSGVVPDPYNVKYWSYLVSVAESLLVGDGAAKNVGIERQELLDSGGESLFPICGAWRSDSCQ